MQYRRPKVLKSWTTEEQGESSSASLQCLDDREARGGIKSRGRARVGEFGGVRGGLYDTSSHAFEVQIDTSSHEGRSAVAVGVCMSRACLRSVIA